MNRMILGAALATATALAGLSASAQNATEPASRGNTDIAAEQQPCGPRDEIVASLTADFGEKPKAMGLQQGESLMEIFASEQTGSFTVLQTDPEGRSCVVAMGSNWTDSMATKAEQRVSF